MQQYAMDGRETISLRGYENGSLSSRDGSIIYNKFSLELRYPVSLKPSASVFALTFLESGNGFDNFKDYSPFDLKRSAGIGVRVFMGFFAAIFDFDIKGIIDRIGNIGSQIANTLKGIAKGAVAMVAAAVPGGESPTEAFTRVYNEVLNTGEGVVKNEAAEIASKPLVEDGAMAAAKAAMTTNESYN